MLVRCVLGAAGIGVRHPDWRQIDPAPPLKGYRCPDQRKPVESQGTQAMMMTAIKRANM